MALRHSGSKPGAQLHRRIMVIVTQETGAAEAPELDKSLSTVAALVLACINVPHAPRLQACPE